MALALTPTGDGRAFLPEPRVKTLAKESIYGQLFPHRYLLTALHNGLRPIAAVLGEGMLEWVERKENVL